MNEFFETTTCSFLYWFAFCREEENCLPRLHWRGGEIQVSFNGSQGTSKQRTFSYKFCRRFETIAWLVIFQGQRCFFFLRQSLIYTITVVSQPEDTSQKSYDLLLYDQRNVETQFEFWDVSWYWDTTLLCHIKPLTFGWLLKYTCIWKNRTDYKATRVTTYLWHATIRPGTQGQSYFEWTVGAYPHWWRNTTEERGFFSLPCSANGWAKHWARVVWTSARI